MKAVVVVPISVFAIFAFFCITSTESLKCYVCQDCAEPTNEMQNCSRNIDKCVKMTLANGEVDRKCAERNQCNGRNGRSKRSVDELIDDCLPHTRIVRQLLGGSDGGGGSSSSSSSKNKNKDKQKEDKGAKEAMEIHCCSDDLCNAAPKTESSCWTPLILLISSLLGVVTSTSSSLSLFFQ